MKLIVGLGNPGKEYQHTRHNLGFILLDKVAKALKIDFNKTKFKSLLAEGRYQNERIVLQKPQTFMNLSGEAVVQAKTFYKIDLPDLIIVHDDLDMEVGQVRYREKGSSGGHNGLKSIIEHLGTQEFSRIKIGIGKPKTAQETHDYVLGKIGKTEVPLLVEAIAKAEQKLYDWLGA